MSNVEIKRQINKIINLKEKGELTNALKICDEQILKSNQLDDPVDIMTIVSRLRFLRKSIIDKKMLLNIEEK